MKRSAQGAIIGAVLMAAVTGAWSATASAEEARPLKSPTDSMPTETSGSWRPPARDPDAKRAKDWLLLKSGELLRGRIEYIRDEEVTFDSDELEDVKLDWDDIAGFGSPRLNTFRFGDEAIVTGTAGMRAGVIRVDTGTEVREFQRSELYSMIEGEPRELDYWSLEGALGLTLRSGNTDQTDLSARLEVKRETSLTRAQMTYETAYDAVEGEDVTDNSRVVGLFAYYLTTRFYLVAPLAELYRDRVRNVDLRGTVAGGAGYDIIEWKKFKWTALGGAGYQRTDFGGVASDEAGTGQDAALIFYTAFEVDPIPDVDWDTSYALVAVVTDQDRTSHHLSSVLSFEVWGPLDLDVSFIWDRIEKPAEDADGEAPESDDLQLTVGVSLEF